VAYAHSITIDATGVDTQINIGFGYIPKHGTETYDLSTGTFYEVFSYPGGYDICRFQVDVNGNIFYDEAKYGGRVQGNGTSTLTIPGHNITLDGTQVDTDLRLSNLGATNWGGSITFSLPANDPNTPGHGYSVFSYPGGYDICSFWVNEDGTVGYDETKYNGRAQGIGTSTLTIPGHNITLDGTNVDTDLQIYCLGPIGTTKYGGSFTYRLPANQENTSAHTYIIKSLPGMYILDRFTVNPDGMVTYDPILDGVTVTGLGTNVLQIIGNPVLFDATEVLPNVSASVYGLNSTKSGEVRLYMLPSNHPSYPYYLYSWPGGVLQDSQFNVNNDGSCSGLEIVYEYGTIRLTCGTDSDGDGVPDYQDICPGGDDNIDTDEDTIPDFCDLCPGSDDNLDMDSDEVPDACDNCQNMANPEQGDGDADGIGNACDNCPLDANTDQADGDNDGVGDTCDLCIGDDNVDLDGDGMCDASDNCPNDNNPEQNDYDNDGKGDVCDNCSGIYNSDQANLDGDSFGDLCDNCPQHTNDDQADNDNDDEGDSCDPDDDNDSVLDGDDNCPFVPNSDQTDSDGNGIGDACDEDDDGDGVSDDVDLCPETELGVNVDEDGCSGKQLVDLDCLCDSDWKNHGQYVSCVAHAAEDQLAASLITQAEKDAIVSELAKSGCGKKK
jgi:hypothetical protein